jgi:hypothetical protein
MLTDWDKNNGIVGRIWNKTSKAGKPFISGYLYLEGQKIDLVGFQNKKREGKNDPDYIIKISSPIEERIEKRDEEISADADNFGTEDSVPF